MLVKLCFLTNMSLRLHDKLTVAHDGETICELLCWLEQNSKKVADLPKIMNLRWEILH